MTTIGFWNHDRPLTHSILAIEVFLVNIPHCGNGNEILLYRSFLWSASSASQCLFAASVLAFYLYVVCEKKRGFEVLIYFLLILSLLSPLIFAKCAESDKLTRLIQLLSTYSQYSARLDLYLMIL